MSGHFERRRHDAGDLAAFAASRGLPMSTERAYRAWCSYSETMAAGWMMYDLDGEGGERTFLLLQGAEAELRAQDAAFVSDEYQDVARLHERAMVRGLRLSQEDVARLWADYSATQGESWSSTRHADIEAVFNPAVASLETSYPGM